MARQFAFALLSVFLIAAAGSASAQIADDRQRQEALRHYRSGQEFLNSEQFEKAEKEFTIAIQLDPLLTLAHYGLGQSFMAQKRYASAVQAFTRCREAFQRLFELRQSDAASMDRRAEQEIRELQDTIAALQSGRVKAMGGSGGTVDSRVAQLEARIRDLKRLRRPDTGTFESPAEVSLSLGSAHFRNGNTAEAEREWKGAVAVNPKLGEAHNNLAVIFLQTGRYAEAEAAVNEAKKSGLRVHPQLERDIKDRKKSG